MENSLSRQHKNTLKDWKADWKNKEEKPEVDLFKSALRDKYFPNYKK